VGSSREPLPATRFGRLSRWKEYKWSPGARAKAAPLHP
jgi:hypothetical protein